MKNEFNKKIIEKTKLILKDLGYEIKTGHIYELFSRLAGFKNWHVAKTKEVDFSKSLSLKNNDSETIQHQKESPSLLYSEKTSDHSIQDLLMAVQQMRIKKAISKKILSLSKDKRLLNMSQYEKMIRNNEFNNILNYGIDLNTKEFIKKNPLVDPGAVFCGGMGSGKTLAMRFTIATHIFSNSSETLYFLFDPMKGLLDYTDFFNLKNFFPINNFSKIVDTIDLIHSELLERKKEFSKHNVYSLLDYNNLMESKNEKKLSKIIFGIEEFHSLITSSYFNFNFETYDINSITNKLLQIMRVGRSFGITGLISTQIANNKYLPSKLKPGLSQLMAFKVYNSNDIISLNLEQNSEDIPSGYPGLCISQDGFIQFPYLDNKRIKELLEKYHKPLQTKVLTSELENLKKDELYEK